MDAGVFYVYLLRRPNGVPCYVGKGKGERWKRHQQAVRTGRRWSNPHLANIIRNAGGSLEIQKTSLGLTEMEAFELERFLIKLVGREENGGPLVNLTDGGEGVSGVKFSADALKKMSASLLGRRAWNAGIKGCWSPEVIARMRAAKLGKKQSPEMIAARSKSLIGRTISPEAREKIAASKRGKKRSAEVCAAIRAARRAGIQKRAQEIASKTTDIWV